MNLMELSDLLTSADHLGFHPINSVIVHLSKLISAFIFLPQVPTKKLKKFEKEYQALRESQLQQEDPIDRYQVSKNLI